MTRKCSQTEFEMCTLY